VPATRKPIGKVLPMLGLAHLDREFDYLIDEQQDEVATPGVRVRVRFSGRLIDGFLLDRVDETAHTGRLGWLERVVSGEPVLDPALPDRERRPTECGECSRSGAGPDGMAGIPRRPVLHRPAAGRPSSRGLAGHRR
jgi:hypothetical protein